MAVPGIAVLVFKSNLFYLIPKHKSSDADNSDTPERSNKLLPLSEKVKVLNLLRKKLYAEVAKTYHNKNESSTHEIVKKKKFVLVLLWYLQLQKL